MTDGTTDGTTDGGPGGAFSDADPSRGGEPAPSRSPDDDGDGASSRSGRSLPVAISVGIVLAAMFLASLFWHPLAFTAVIILLATIGLIETGRTLDRLGRPVAVPVLLVAMLVVLLGTYRAGTAGQVVGLLVLFLGAVAWELAAPDRHEVVATIARTVFFGLWVGFLASFGVLLATRPSDGPVAVLAVIGGAVVSDIGGYAFGTVFGRRRIAPSISPKKSWEGLVGGLATVAIVAAVVLPRIGDLFEPWTAIAVAVAAAIAGFFGDLTESMVKRDLGVKDLGDVLPGHGGILDRVDGILLALPVGYYATALLT